MNRFDNIVVKSTAGVKTITLNRPDKRNALTPALIDELATALDEAESCDCGVVVLTGAGPAFCAGMDIEHLELNGPSAVRNDAENMARVLRTLYEFPKPVIAAVNGAAIAAGMSLATIADFTLAAPEAKFGYNEVRVGFVPAIEASFLLRQVGEKRTRELLLTGRLLKAQEALHLGLVTHIVAATELLQSAQALACGLLQNSPQAMQATKTLLAKHAQRRLDEEIEDAIAANAEHLAREDFLEGISAFRQHRKAEWPSRNVKV